MEYCPSVGEIFTRGGAIMEMITIDQLGELKDAVEKAREDDTPYIGIKDEELHILGDPNKTEIKAADYVVHFAFPNTEEWKAKAIANGDEIGKTTKDGRYFLATRQFKNVYLSPRRMGAVVSTLAQLESFLYKITDNGEVKDMSYEEMLSLVSVMNGELSDSTYELVATVLRIPYEEMEWMLPLDAIENAVKIATNNPSAVNEADLFFASPHENK